MNYGKIRTPSDSDESNCVFSVKPKSASLPPDLSYHNNFKGPDTVSNYFRHCFEWFYSSFVNSVKMPYQIFLTKNETEEKKNSTDVFPKLSPESRSQSVTANATPKFSFGQNQIMGQNRQFNNYSRANLDRCFVCREILKVSKCPNCRRLNSRRFSSASFYGKSRQKIEDCIDIAGDDDLKLMSVDPVANENESPVVSTVESTAKFDDVEEISYSNEQREIATNNNEIPQELQLSARSVYFGTYSCCVKGLTISNDFFKFCNVPSPISEKFKYHITIPLSEIIDIASSVSDIETCVLLRTDPSSTSKIINALSLNCEKTTHVYSPENEAGNAPYIIVEFDSLSRSQWISIENIIRRNNKIQYRKMTLSDVNSIRLRLEHINSDCGKTNSSNASVASVEKRKDSLPHHKSPKPKQIKVNNVIEIDDSCDSQSGNEGSTSEIVLNYPHDGIDSIAIFEYDMNCLQEEQFLNDSILCFYLKYIHRELTDESVASKVYIFNTFFYGKLSKSRKSEDSAKTYPERVYERVKNWTKSVDIFEKDFLIIPMNKNYHWFLAIVCYPKLVAESGKSHWSESCKRDHNPCIIYMDSLGAAKERPRLSDPIRHFLSMEWKKKKGTTLSFDKKILPDYYPRVPYQTNSTDCGLFVLEYVEQFLKDPNFVMSNLSTLKLEDWFSVSVIDTKRRHLRSLIEQLKANEPELKMEVCESEKSSLNSVTSREMKDDLESPIPYTKSVNSEDT